MARSGSIRRAHGLAALIVGLVAVLSATSVTGQEAPPSRFGDPTAGEHLFSERGCVRCHAIWGNGGGLGPDLAQVGLGRSLLQLAGMFWNHTPRMIQTVQSRGYTWSTFSQSDLADVISYVYYVKLFDQPGDPNRGAQAFREKRCVECHSVGGRGGQIGPALDGYATYLASIPLAAGMWNHGRTMRAQQSAMGVPLPRFFADEMTDIQAFIRAQALRAVNRVELLPPPDPEQGGLLFRQKRCTACHGPSGRGTSHGPDLRTAIQQLRASEIAGELWNHSPVMSDSLRERGVVFPEFTGTELADVIAYLYYLRFDETAGSVGAGRALFADKGCSQCHALEGTPSIGPNLAESAAVSTPMGLATAMWNHAPSMYQRTQEAGISWPLFQGDEMRDLAAYLRSLGSDGRAPGEGRN
jgi:cytochrome c2